MASGLGIGSGFGFGLAASHRGLSEHGLVQGQHRPPQHLVTEAELREADRDVVPPGWGWGQGLELGLGLGLGLGQG